MASGFVRLYAPTAYAAGSSISHFDTVATPNLLMEPFSTPDTRSNVNVDLTPALFEDIGWKIETLKLGACDTGVKSVLGNGVMLHAQADACAANTGNNAQYTACINDVVKAAGKTRGLAGWEQSAIMKCAAKGRP